ncbi:MAG: hypothetical protein HN732_03200, partial [Rhodospirillaceae bacterium]|nr:hypothetical protein [Rhodospirillaceae bacterium]
MLTKDAAFTTEDIAYLDHGTQSGAGPLMLRYFRPAGPGPFPLIVDLHGGAWTMGDLSGCQARDEVLAG